MINLMTSLGSLGMTQKKKWNSADVKLYLALCKILLTKTDVRLAWKWARHIVNVNKYNKEHKHEAK